MNSASLPPNAEPLNPTEASPRNYAATARQYVDDVLEGRISACKWVRLACRRQVNDLTRTDWPWSFDETKANRVCRFIEQLPHIEGEWAAKGEKIRLEPWQCFWLCCVFGWVHRETGYRRFRIAYICIPRKNGKSLQAGGVGNYMFCADAEFGAQVYAGATSKRQAQKVFGPAKKMIQRSPRLRELFGIHIGAGKLVIFANGSEFEPIIGNPGDGDGPSCAIVDEYHEHKTDRLVDAMQTGTGARRQPLVAIITTAGSNIAGPCHELQTDIEKILEGTIERDNTFGIIYTIDEEDDWTTEQALIKANPNYGVSVYADYLRSQQAIAMQNPAKQNIFLTKHLNIWVGADRAWMNMQSWKALGDSSLRIEDFRGLPCWMGVDLASKRDITAEVLIFLKPNGSADHYYAFGRYFLPELVASDPKHQHYQKWKLNGHLHVTPGRVINYDAITEQVIADVREYRPKELGFDPWNAEQFSQRVVTKTGVTSVEIPNQVRFLSEPMKQLEALIIDERFHHDANPALAWMMSNVVAHTDKKDNIFPNKERAESKIDGAVAVIMALSRSLISPPLIEAGIL